MNNESAVFETKEDALKVNTTAQAWLKAIKVSEDGEKEWRKKAKEVSCLYVNEGERKQKFNILYSNTQTIVPAIYNSQPAPDIRERYGEQEDGKIISRVMERAVSFNLDNYDFHPTLQDCVIDTMLVGRGVPRVRYNPELSSTLDPLGNPIEVVKYQSVSCELVHWEDFVIGSARRWNEVPWVAFKHRMTKDQVKKLNPELADQVSYDETVDTNDNKTVSEAPSLFKRTLVYEIWDKEAGEVLFIAASYDKDVLQRGSPAINLRGFFPVPRPLYAVRRTDSLKPTIPYTMYEEQAKELEELTKRISALIKCLKWRGEVFTACKETKTGVKSTDKSTNGG